MLPLTRSACEPLIGAEPFRSQKLEVKSKTKREGPSDRAETASLVGEARCSFCDPDAAHPGFSTKSTGNAGCKQSRMTPKPYDFRERSFLFACDVVAFARVVADRG